MTQNKQDKGAVQATNKSTGKSSIGHYVRMAVCILSAGFVFPHAFTEGMDDIAPNVADKNTEVNKQ